jgi:DNA integrity scanning protein DisA with diadenylate cyclase activity
LPRKGGDKRYYYRCPAHYAPPYLCGNKSVMSELALEKYLLDNVKSELSNYIFKCKEESAPARNAKTQISALENKINRLKELFINGFISMDEYREDREKYEKEIEKLSDTSLPEPIDTSALEKILAKDFTNYYWNMSPEEKRYFWRSFVKEIRISEDKHITIFFL